MMVVIKEKLFSIKKVWWLFSFLLATRVISIYNMYEFKGIIVFPRSTHHIVKSIRRLTVWIHIISALRLKRRLNAYNIFKQYKVIRLSKTCLQVRSFPFRIFKINWPTHYTVLHYHENNHNTCCFLLPSGCCVNYETIYTIFVINYHHHRI